MASMRPEILCLRRRAPRFRRPPSALRRGGRCRWFRRPSASKSSPSRCRYCLQHAPITPQRRMRGSPVRHHRRRRPRMPSIARGTWWAMTRFRPMSSAAATRGRPIPSARPMSPPRSRRRFVGLRPLRSRPSFSTSWARSRVRRRRRWAGSPFRAVRLVAGGAETASSL
jgi:hypothetical protein